LQKKKLEAIKVVPTKKPEANLPKPRLRKPRLRKPGLRKPRLRKPGLLREIQRLKPWSKTCTAQKSRCYQKDRQENDEKSGCPENQKEVALIAAAALPRCDAPEGI